MIYEIQKSSVSDINAKCVSDKFSRWVRRPIKIFIIYYISFIC